MRIQLWGFQAATDPALPLSASRISPRNTLEKSIPSSSPAAAVWGITLAVRGQLLSELGLSQLTLHVVTKLQEPPDSQMLLHQGDKAG